jgi:NAD(P)-dependent dehydrogenase (short-subunit alcohol dehydrogenase family)
MRESHVPFEGRFAGKVAVVTGGAHGIGAATVRRLADEGAAVVIADIEAEATEKLASRTRAGGGRAIAAECDVADAADWARLRDRTLAEYGRVDVLVANAYAMTRGLAHELPEEAWDRTIDVCLKSTYLALRVLAEPLLAARGSIVLVSSVHATSGTPGFSAYAAAKGGLVAYARQLAVEYGPQLRVNSVLPGPIRTRQWDTISDEEARPAIDNTAAGRLGTPDEVAAAIAFLAADEAAYVTGVALPVDGGWSIARRTP